MHDKMKLTFLQEQKSNPDNCHMLNAISVPGYEFIPNIDSPRFIKTHLPFSLMPPSVMAKQAKVIYVARNPKDVIVSYYYLSRTFRTTGYVNNFETFWEYFEKDLSKTGTRSLEYFAEPMNSCFYCSCLVTILGAHQRRMGASPRAKCTFHVLRRHEQGTAHLI